MHPPAAAHPLKWPIVPGTSLAARCSRIHSGHAPQPTTFDFRSNHQHNHTRYGSVWQRSQPPLPAAPLHETVAA